MIRQPPAARCRRRRRAARRRHLRASPRSRVSSATRSCKAGHINHALFAASSQVAYSWVYPAEKSDGLEKDAKAADTHRWVTLLSARPRLHDGQAADALPALEAARSCGRSGTTASTSVTRPTPLLKPLSIESGHLATPASGCPDPWLRYVEGPTVCRSPLHLDIGSHGLRVRHTTAAWTGASCA